jgi:tetratricopeptide (TPR) repeat protein
MAEQVEPVRRRVALKIIKAGMDTAQVIARFEAERQALALMDHPNIAKVLDAGATGGGRPYFVMELVQGVPITKYCDDHKFTPQQRLELFMRVCQAIQHAHQKGIIHRDIKPSNILVTEVDGRPAPKVIDFGVAKATNQILTEKTLFTQFGAIVGTPEYMSPEQAGLGSMDIDTRSDIYSLGVLLYELLTGSTPLRRESLRQAAFTEILRRIQEEEPATPSSRLMSTVEEDRPQSLPFPLASIAANRNTSPMQLSKIVRGDLDWIVMKALDKDRTRRYETASGMARDIQRHLEGDAVEAGPPSASYKLKKFARKHRVALATTAAFAGLLFAATVTSSVLAFWANRERSRAVEAEATAVAERKRAEEREQMAIQAVSRFSDVIQESPELKNHPQLGALRLKLLKEPLAFFTSLRDRLSAYRESSYGLEPLQKLGTAAYFQGWLPHQVGNHEGAVAAMRESIAMKQKLADAHPGVPSIRKEIVDNYVFMAEVQREMGRIGEALDSYRKERETLEGLVKENPFVVQFRSDLAQCHKRIGRTHQEAGKLDEARVEFERARGIEERLTQEYPDTPEYASELGGTFNDLAAVEMASKRHDVARKRLQEALEIQGRAVAANPQSPMLRVSVSNHLRRSISLARGIGDDATAGEAQRMLYELAASDTTHKALDSRLEQVMKGAKPKDNGERIHLAYRAYHRGHLAASARLFGDSLEGDAKLADNRQAQHRYNAACAAALAAGGAGSVEPALNDDSKAGLRDQARQWLEAELDTWSKVLESASEQERTVVAPTLSHWKQDPDLAEVRDDAALKRLTEAERRDWRALWGRVDALLAKATEQPSESLR